MRISSQGPQLTSDLMSLTNGSEKERLGVYKGVAPSVCVMSVLDTGYVWSSTITVATVWLFILHYCLHLKNKVMVQGFSFISTHSF